MGNNYTSGNDHVYSYGIPVPSNLTVEYNGINTVCTVDDIYLPNVQIEFWIKINNQNYILHELTAVNTFISNIELYGCRLEVKARTLKDGVYSGFCDPKVIEQVPLMLLSDQSGGIVGVTIDTLNIAVGGTVHVDWGDGNANDYNGNNVGIFHNYGDTLDYPVNITGDLDMITNLTVTAQVVNHGRLDQWLLPLFQNPCELDFNACNFTGIPRGNYFNVIDMDCSDNNSNDAEVNAFLFYLSNFFVNGFLPIQNAAFTIDGAGMGTPDAAGLLCETDVTNKFTAAGYTATFTTN